jgi:hypothetical protein
MCMHEVYSNSENCRLVLSDGFQIFECRISAAYPKLLQFSIEQAILKA